MTQCESKRKYKARYQIESMTAFDEFDGDWFIVRFGNRCKTIHRSFLISWQYRTLKAFVDRGDVCAAERIGE